MFRVTVEFLNSSYTTAQDCKTFDCGEFETKKEANKFKREMIKKHSMIRHAGHIVNYSESKELYTNY